MENSNENRLAEELREVQGVHEIIRVVLENRSDGDDKYTVKTAVLDIYKILHEQTEAEGYMTSKEAFSVLQQAGVPGTRARVSNAISDMIDAGELEFIGRVEKTTVIGTSFHAPAYKYKGNEL